MNDVLKAFLKFLELNRNASRHTVRAYESDLSQFLSFVAVERGVKRSQLLPANLDRAAIRGFLAELHRTGRSRATAKPNGGRCPAAHCLIRSARTALSFGARTWMP